MATISVLIGPLGESLQTVLCRVFAAANHGCRILAFCSGDSGKLV